MQTVVTVTILGDDGSVIHHYSRAETTPYTDDVPRSVLEALAMMQSFTAEANERIAAQADASLTAAGHAQEEIDKLRHGNDPPS